MARKPWYKALFERDYHDYFYQAGPSPRTPEAEAKRAEVQVDFILGTLELPEGGRVLDLCCAWGRHSIPLAQRGFRVTGLDLSKYHIRLAKQAGKRAGVDVEWVNADMRDVPGRARYEAVFNCFTSFGYLETDAENQRVLNGIRRALKPGGRFFIDTMNHENLMRIFRESEFRELPDGAFMMERRAYDIKTGRTNVDWFYQPQGGERIHGFHSLRLYTFTELTVMLDKAGLAVRAAWGGFDGSEYTMYSPRMIVLAEKA